MADLASLYPTGEPGAKLVEEKMKGPESLYRNLNALRSPGANKAMIEAAARNAARSRSPAAPRTVLPAKRRLRLAQPASRARRQAPIRWTPVASASSAAMTRASAEAGTGVAPR